MQHTDLDLHSTQYSTHTNHEVSECIQYTYVYTHTIASILCEYCYVKFHQLGITNEITSVTGVFDVNWKFV